MNATAEKRGASLGVLPHKITPKETETPRIIRPTSKQTVEISRKALGRIREICTTESISFQDFTIHCINRELHARGEPSIEELEAGE